MRGFRYHYGVWTPVVKRKSLDHFKQEVAECDIPYRKITLSAAWIMDRKGKRLAMGISIKRLPKK